MCFASNGFDFCMTSIRQGVAFCQLLHVQIFTIIKSEKRKKINREDAKSWAKIAKVRQKKTDNSIR
jgi:hypothetical protein